MQIVLQRLKKVLYNKFEMMKTCLLFIVPNVYLFMMILFSKKVLKD